MKVCLDWKKAVFRRTAVAIGVFDGVHVGHRAILAAAAALARRRRLKMVALTMDPHPSHVLHPETRTHLLYSLEHRLELLEELGVSAAVVLRFNRAMAGMSAAQFVREILVKRMGAMAVAVGSDFRFGHKALGDVSILAQAGRAAGFDVRAVEPVLRGGRPVSSSRIRQAVASARFETASSLLGRPYGLFGIVVRGDGRGQALGFPTINLRLDHELLPPPGVYAVWARTGRRTFRGVMHLGPRPTFDSPEPRVECHLLRSPALSLYGKEFEIIPIKRLRPVRRFGSTQALSRQIALDVAAAGASLRS